jgi:hypothetical protein
MEPFLAQLANLCRSNPTGVKWVFLPSHVLSLTLGERLALESTDWANLRFEPPFSTALQMAAPFLVEAGVDPAPEDIGHALTMRPGRRDWHCDRLPVRETPPELKQNIRVFSARSA